MPSFCLLTKKEGINTGSLRMENLETPDLDKSFVGSLYHPRDALLFYSLNLLLELSDVANQIIRSSALFKVEAGADM